MELTPSLSKLDKTSKPIYSGDVLTQLTIPFFF
jgi:hypothetical protein